MSDPLLHTKLQAPRLRARLVPRPALIQRLNQGRSGKLTQESLFLMLEEMLLRLDAESGRIELATAPWGDPVLPLMLDFAAAREAQPGLILPVHHAYPGGLVTHTNLNTRVSVALYDGYRQVYDYMLDRDVVVAAQLLHDLHKPWVFQWGKDGQSRGAGRGSAGHRHGRLRPRHRQGGTRSRTARRRPKRRPV